jgi:trehalose synthase
VALLHEVHVNALPVGRLEPVIGTARYQRLVGGATQLREQLGDRTIWNVSSTAVGGGVAEMLRVLLGYVADLDFPVRWVVIGGDPAFFEITKRLHNQIHGAVGAGGLVGGTDAQHYEEVLAANAAELTAAVQPGDIVLLHDPQTAGLAGALAGAGARVVWRCHIGADTHNEATRCAWNFLRPYLEPAFGFVFTRRQYAPSWAPPARTWVIAPSIDPFAPKNADLDPEDIRAVLATIGLLKDPAGRLGRFTRADGTQAEVTRGGRVIGERRPGPEDPLVVQVSRWDRLKDMAGVMRGFAAHVAPDGSYLVLAGPDVGGVTDDPEGAAVFAECLEQWHQLPAAARARVLLVTLPLDDPEENAVMVNAIQRHACVIVQKSLVEGFGLTVAEGMWKARPVIGSAVGGIVDQIADGTGILLSDPADLAAFGAQVQWMLDHRGEAARMGERAKEYARVHFIGDVHLLRLADVARAAIAG